jgi:CRP-like cAMP-binding protein
MLFPGSRVWYEGAAADLASLSGEIRATGFTGHAVLEFQDSIAVVICAGGEFLRVVERIGRRVLSTAGCREILGQCQNKPGRMTIFELPPRLSRRLRELRARRLFRSGTATSGCDAASLLDELRDRAFSGTLDCVSPEGKLLLDFERGLVASCHFTEYAGLSREGLEAFAAWHRGFARARAPSLFFVSDPGGPGDGLVWDEILMAGADRLPRPLPSSIERLCRAFGRDAAEGEVIVPAGAHPRQACYLVDGELELLPVEARAWSGGAPLQAGEFFGLGWLCAGEPSPVTVRARTASRYLALDAKALDAVFANSPMLGERLVRAAAAALAAVRARTGAYRSEPRLRDVDSAVTQVLHRHPRGGREGVPAAELFRELTQILPLSLPEIDTLFRGLLALGGLVQSNGRISVSARGLL